MEIEDKIKNMKKVELHLHLDGSLRSSTVKELLNNMDSNSYSEDEVKNMLTVDKDCSSLNEYLKKFQIPNKVMQTEESLKRVTYELIEDLKKENVIYAEIRFAPQLHIAGGLSYDEIVTSVISGMNKGMKDGNIKCNLILCCMRGNDNQKLNIDTVEIARKYLNKGVCAIDLAGAEAIYKTSEFEYIFELARKLNVPYTIHAGEADGKESVKTAISFGTKRLGHGVRIIEDENLIKEAVKKGVTLEVCPTSNLHTNVVSNITLHPVYNLYKSGLNITINTDNRTVSNTTLQKEYMLLINNFDFSYNDLVEMNKNAIKAAFLSDSEKIELLEELLN